MREMKDSGVEWIGEMPKEWRVAEIKVYCEAVFAGGTPRSDNTSYWDGDIPWIPSGSCHDSRIINAPKSITSEGFENSSTKLIPANTTVMAMTGATCANTGFLTFDSCANQSVAAYVPKSETYSLYLWYMLQAAREHILTFQTGGAQGGVNIEDCKNIIVPYIGFSEQKVRADYLDFKCSQIDSVIAKQEEIIEKLKEYKLSIITEAVTKGLDPNAEMKDSGIEWLRFIPSCSEIVRFQDLGDFRKGPFGSSITRDMFIEKSDRAFKVYEQKNAIYKDASLGYYYIDEDKYRELSNFAINPGDIIVSCAGTIGECYILPVSCEKGIINQALMRIRIADDVNARYIVYLFSAVLKYYSEKYSNGSAIKNMPPFSIIKKIRVPRFPYDMQCEIADWLDVKINQIDKAISRLTMETDMLHQYEKELLFEVVTGKKEV